MIISISGRKLVGKDTTADVLVRKFGFKKVGLADSLKSILANALNIPIADFYDQTKKELKLTDWLEFDVLLSSQIDRVIQETNARFPLNDLDKMIMDNFFRQNAFTTLRDLMQKFGTECCRQNIDPDIWLKILGSQIANCDKNYVCCDVRFPNEREFFRSLGAKLWLINRELPNAQDSHASENQLGDISEYTLIINNNKTILSLVRKVSKTMREVHGKDIS